ncbi:hypothetical protein [Rhizobium sp. 'Codium 1']|uniref:hypothetical protein n=1 Tax=Rhizobium sp. 'Codium 1' TaxID=2940484 RepID=UPI001E52EECE|nr:hypothetical protein [Rhizobium sp. 'Codium 1']MCC8931918.1 hypothetical protein [Rhizobium sp. 'Codium 1']
MTSDETKQQQLAITISRSTSHTEADALRLWAQGLLSIRESDLSSYAKGRQAIALTASSKVIMPVLKMIARQSKTYGWDRRSPAQRIGMGAAATGIALFGGANAGIAALGTAIGVPLWIVLGGGAMFAKYLIDELSQRRSRDGGAASYRVIDAEKEE